MNLKIETIVTDGAKMYPAIMERLGIQHKLCNFHKNARPFKAYVWEII